MTQKIKTTFQTSPKQYIENMKKQVSNNSRQFSQPSPLPSSSASVELQKLKTITSQSHEKLKELKNINMEKLKVFLGEDWEDYKNNPKALELWDELLFKNSLIEQGKIPDNFTAITCCDLCGDVYVPPSLVNGGRVLGCPWCWNRAKGLPIPRPSKLRQYFARK